MQSPTYQQRRGELETYFDRTAADAWAKLTSDAPVSGVRATVRAGRERMRATLLSWLPDDLTGRRVLDAGAGSGAFALEAARRGADVVAVDLSPTLTSLAQERAQDTALAGSIDYRVGDMLDAALGSFDHVAAMDSLIHYRAGDMAQALAGLAERTTGSIVFTFAPKTPALTAMHAVGRLFPRGDRAPSIEPVGEANLRRRLEAALGEAWTIARTERIVSGFYTSQAMELARR